MDQENPTSKKFIKVDSDIINHMQQASIDNFKCSVKEVFHEMPDNELEILTTCFINGYERGCNDMYRYIAANVSVK